MTITIEDIQKSLDVMPDCMTIKKIQMSEPNKIELGVDIYKGIPIEVNNSISNGVFLIS